ncbi:serine/threonine protein kinase, partial [Streptomyces sp. NPDC058664]|uniref:serine/threonine protein kinase n=1 Tax=Streptomyces sp. NPDC058664 TaxID=3346585 RepID=UPI00364657E1
MFLTDFGIARLRADSTHLTQQGMFTATLAYASPEQMTGAELDHRSDQYSLACSLYWLFTGVAPFDSADPNEIIRGTLYAPPPPLALRRAGLPPIMDAVLAAAMAKHPAARFDSCAAFAKAARQALTSKTPPVLPRPPANPAPGYYPPAPQQGPAAPFVQPGMVPPGMVPPGYQAPPMQPVPQPHWQPPSRPFGAVAPAPQHPPAAPPGGAAGMPSSPVSLDKPPAAGSLGKEAADDEVSATAATDVLATRDADALDAANAAALTEVTSIAGPPTVAPAGSVPPPSAAGQSSRLGPAGEAEQGNAGRQRGAGQPGSAGQPGGMGQPGNAGQQPGSGQQGEVPPGHRGPLGPYRGYWPVPRRVSGMQRFGWVVLVALVLVLIALVVALVVVVLPDDDGDLDAAGGANVPSSSVAEVADSFGESRRVFPTLVPQGENGEGVGYRGARCVGVRSVSELAWKEPALQWTPVETAWQCDRVDNQVGAVSYLVLE